jgi:ATP-dependent Zn protease
VFPCIQISYEDIVGNKEAKESLQRLLKFSTPIMRLKLRSFGINSMGGALLHGPPGNTYMLNFIDIIKISFFSFENEGNCKTRLVMAAAASHGLPIISLSSADVYSAYLGDWRLS